MSGSFDQARHERLSALFAEAAKLADGEQQAAFIAESCADDPELAAELAALLDIDQTDSPLRDRLAGSGLVESLATERDTLVGRQIGDFKLLEVLGAGGMGTVYRAQQDEPERDVALKVMHRSLSSSGAAQRFRFEAQLLAQLQHPYVAKVFDAGTFSEGDETIRYFAMEYVREGKPITTFADENGLSVRERLRLFLDVCDAVQHGHQHGIIHRDLKPDNILVDGNGHPKVIDFGLARATETHPNANSLLTSFGCLLGTLNYMSPEQVTGDPRAVDTRSDVYALGVILFELIGGRLPLDLTSCTVAEGLRRILQDDPMRLGSVNVRFRGDLEVMALKALEKDKDRRYESPADLAADVKRHLEDEPILARAPSAIYQLKKFARRHKGLVTGLVLTALALIGGTVVALTQRADAIRARIAAEDRAYRADLTAAEAALRAGDVARARESLEAARGGRAGWEWYHLHSRLDQSTLTLDVEPSMRTGITFTHGGRRLERWWNRPTSVASFDATTGKRLWSRPIKGYLRRLLSGKLIVRSERSRWRLEDSETGREIDTWQWPALWRMEKSDDPERIVVVTADKRVQWRDVKRRTLHDLMRVKARTTRIAISRDGSVLALAEPGLVGAYSVATGARIDQWQLPGEVSIVVVSPDGKTIGHCGRRGLTLFRVGDPVPTRREIRSHINDAAFSPDGRYLATASADHALRLWDALTGEQYRALVGHSSAPERITFAPDSRSIASLAHSGEIKLWNVEVTDPFALAAHDRPTYDLDATSDGRLVATASWDGAIRLWDGKAGVEVAHVVPSAIRPSLVRGVALSDDGRYVAFQGAEGRFPRKKHTGWVGVFDCRTGVSRKLAEAGGARDLGQPLFDESRARLIVATQEGLAAWQLPSFEKIANVRHHPRHDSWPRAAISPDHRWIATVNEEAIVVWDAATLSVAIELTFSAQWMQRPTNERRPRAIAFTPNSDGLVMTSAEEAWRWDLRTKQPEVLRSDGSVRRVAYLPDGSRVAVAGLQNVIEILDGETWQKIAELRGHRNAVLDLEFAGSGPTLFSSSAQGTLRMWTVQPMQALRAARAEYRERVARLEPDVERLFAAHEPAAAWDRLATLDLRDERDREVAENLARKRVLATIKLLD